MGIINSTICGAKTPEPTFCGNFSAGSGTRIVNGHIVTGLTSAAGAYYPRTSADEVPTYDMTKPFHIHIRVKASALTSSGNGQSVLGGEVATATQYQRPLILLLPQANTNLFEARFSTNGTVWVATLGIGKDELPFIADKWYTVDYSWANGVFAFSASDGETTITKSVETEHYYNASTLRVAIGRGIGYAMHCFVDLLDTYWEQDGALLWGNKS